MERGRSVVRGLTFRDGRQSGFTQEWPRRIWGGLQSGGSIRREVVQDGAPLIIPLGFLLTSLSNSADKGEDLSWPQGARGEEGDRLGKGPGWAGGDWERSPGEGDSRDWATVITASEKALARERRGAAVVGGRGEAEEHGGKG